MEPESARSYRKNCSLAPEDRLVKYRQALTQLAQRYYLRDPLRADELAQDVLTAALDTLRDGKYVEQDHMGAWLRVNLRNRCINLLRQNARLNDVSLDSADATGFSLLDTDIGGKRDPEIEGIASRIDIQRCIDALPYELREVIVSAHRGESRHETAMRLNGSLGRVKWLIEKARKSLQKCLGRDY